MAWRNLTTKAARLNYRQAALDSIRNRAEKFELTEYPEADCVAATYTQGNLYAIIYDGDAGKPYSHFRYRSEEYRAKAIAEQSIGNRFCQDHPASN